MADLSKSTYQKYAYLDQLSTEKLEELLKMGDLSQTDDAPSEYFDSIEEVILNREEKEPTGRLSDIEISWKEFCEQYNTPEGKGERLYSEEDLSENVVINRTPSAQTEQVLRHNKPIRRIIVIAAIITVILGGLVAAKAAGVDILGKIADWTDDFFYFVTQGDDKISPESDATEESTEIYDTIKEKGMQYNFQLPGIPQYFPKGYRLEEISYGENHVTSGIFCILSNQSGNLLTIDIQKYIDSEDVGNFIVEKDLSSVEEFISVDGRRVYIMENLGTLVAAWADDDWCITIDGPLDCTELKRIINSIGE